MAAVKPTAEQLAARASARASRPPVSSTPTPIGVPQTRGTPSTQGPPGQNLTRPGVPRATASPMIVAGSGADPNSDMPNMGGRRPGVPRGGGVARGPNPTPGAPRGPIGQPLPVPPQRPGVPRGGAPTAPTQPPDRYVPPGANPNQDIWWNPPGQPAPTNWGQNPAPGYQGPPPGTPQSVIDAWMQGPGMMYQGQPGLTAYTDGGLQATGPSPLINSPQTNPNWNQYQQQMQAMEQAMLQQQLQQQAAMQGGLSRGFR